MINLDKYLKLLNISQLTPIQEKCIEPIFNEESVFALAPTGSGKTLAFVLPLLIKISTALRAPQVIILVPTRELGMQIAGVAQSVANAISQLEEGSNILVRSVFGGTPILPQVHEMQKNPHVVIATPGRLIDLLEREAIHLSNLKTLVLDEADIMVGMGFSDQLETIFDYMPLKLQFALFSATQNDKVTDIEKLILRNVKIHKIDLRAESENNSDYKIKHEYIVTNKEDKLDLLFSILASEKFAKGIIFCHTRETVQQIASHLKSKGLSVDGLTGELGQVHRNSIMRNFKTGNLNFLVATNIAARGIDVSLLPVVIHYDIPYKNDEYVHRSGRTGRAGKSGISLTICEHKNVNYYLNMIRDLELSCELFDRQTIINKEKEKKSESTNATAEIKFIKLFVSKGKQNKIRPVDIVGAFIKELNLEKSDIGNIFIFDHFTHVEVNAKKYLQDRKSKIKVKNVSVNISISK